MLIGHGWWLCRGDFVSGVIFWRGRLAGIDWRAALTGLAAGEWPCTTSDEKVLRLAASLAEQCPIDLGRALWGLDRGTALLAAAAVARAAGHPDVVAPSPGAGRR